MVPISHPLDLEIADLVEGTLDSDSARRVEAHLVQCLLCRIKRQRLVGQAALALQRIDEAVIPDFARIETEEIAGDGAAPGELWTTRSNDALMVLIQSADEHEVSVVPVILDVEVSDDESVVVPAHVSPLQLEIAVYARLRANIPTSALHRRVIPVQDVDLTEVLAGDFVLRGPAIEGPGDPRLEIRQFLTDSLTGLTPHQPEPLGADDPTQRSPDEQYRRLVEMLADYRPAACVVPFRRLRIPDAVERRWIGIARVDESGIVVLAIDTPARLSSRSEFIAAHRLLTRCDGSALVIAASETSDLCDLFEASGLFGATQVPEGDFARVPAIQGMPLEDAVAKYLDIKTEIPLGFGSTTRGEHVHVEDILVRQVSKAVDSMVNTGARITAKRAGFQSIAGSARALSKVLRSALSGTLNPDEVASIPWESKE
jgi:hypothetical protein